MSIDDIVALIAGTDREDVKESLLPALNKLDKIGEGTSHSNNARSSLKGKGKDSIQGGAAGDQPQSQGTPTGHVLEGKLSDGKDPLDVLDPREKTVGYLYILNARLSTQVTDLQYLMPKVYDWVRFFDPFQARLVNDQVMYFVSQLNYLAQAANDVTISLQPLKFLVQLYAPTGTLTVYHAIFLRNVLQTKAYRMAFEVLQVDITDVDKSNFPIRYQDHLLYHYLGGTILALSGNYIRASEFLEICVSAPGPAVSLIQIDAYKKLVLVQLLAYGKTLALPKYTSSTASNAYKTLCTPYLEYASAFVGLDKAKVASAKEKGRETFNRDFNLGLVSLCDSSLRRRVIQKLTETWATLSLGQLTNMLGMDGDVEEKMDEFEEELRQMVQAREIFATLTPSPSSPSSRSNTVITFLDDPEPYLSHETIERVTQAIEKAKRLESGWAREGERLEEGKEFVQKVISSIAAGGGVGGGIGGNPGSIFPPSSMNDRFSNDDFDYGSTGGFGSGIGGSGGGSGSTWVDDDHGSESELEIMD